MNGVERNVWLYFAASRAMVTLSSDFFRNCLTQSPHLHSHPKFELHYVVSGGCLMKTQTEVQTCPPGWFLLVPPHCLHSVRPTQAKAQTLTFTFVLQAQKGADPVAAALSGSQPRLIPDDFGGRQRLACVQQELAQRRTAYDEKIRGELTALLADVARALSDGDVRAPALAEENRAERIETYLMEHCFEPDCSCAALAAQLNLSCRQLHRLCLQYFDAPFRLLLQRMRMETADHRLQTTDVPVTQLAAQLGYASAASFSAAYKRYFGHAPTKKNV